MKRYWKRLLVIVFVFLLASPVFAADIPSGWVNEGGNTFYYENGSKVNGWLKISGNYYYFNENGLQRNTIVGSKSEGCFYVDKDGVRITDKEIALAVKFVMKYSSNSDSPKGRLKDCYNALRDFRYIRIYRNNPSAKMVPSYANYMFTRKGGNCFRYASAYAYIARVLGFDVRVCAGGVNTRNGQYLSPHGWCEVKIDNVWKIVDCSLGRHHWRHNLFLTTRGSYPFRARCDKIFTMKVTNHKICWAQKRDSWRHKK